MACAGHKSRTESGPGRPFTLNTTFTVNTLLEKLYHTMSATGKVIKYNLKNTKKKRIIFHWNDQFDRGRSEGKTESLFL